MNIYAFVVNNPAGNYDVLGLENVSIVVTTLIRPPDPKDGERSLSGAVMGVGRAISARAGAWAPRAAAIPARTRMVENTAFIGPVATNGGHYPA